MFSVISIGIRIFVFATACAGFFVECSPPADAPPTTGYISKFNIKTAHLPTVLGGTWHPRQDARTTLTFEATDEAYAIRFKTPDAEEVFENVQIQCNEMSICEALVEEGKFVLLTFEIVDKWFIYLMQFPKQPVPVKDYETGLMDGYTMRLPFSLLFQKPGAPKNVLM